MHTTTAKGKGGKFQIESNGSTVWLNGPPHGWMLARFGPRVWELNDRVGQTGPGKRGKEAWEAWTAEVHAKFGVQIGADHRPTWL
jgi:hypothetical protein